MKPRQTLKNHHSNFPPPYQHLIQNSAMLPPQSTAPASMPPPLQPPPQRDSDLSKLGLSLEDMATIQSPRNRQPNYQVSRETLECFQKITGKSYDELLDLFPQLNEGLMQSISPPVFPRPPPGTGDCSSSVGVGCGSNSSMSNCSSIVSGGSASGPTSFNNDINNGNSCQQKHDAHFPNALHLHQATASAINNFGVSTANIHSPQSSQQKSALSLHRHHQNDSSNRRLNYNHNLSAATNASYANFNTAAAATSMSAAPSSSNASLQTLDKNHSLSTFGIGMSNKNPSSSYNTNAANNLASQDIMSKLGGMSMSNIFYDNTTQQEAGPIAGRDLASSSKQSSIRHQQLHKLLNSTSSQVKPSTMQVSSEQQHHRNDSQNIRNLDNSISHIQRQLAAPASAISPPNQQPSYSSVPKSLLNLAACSSSSPPNSSSPNSISKLTNLANFNLPANRSSSSSSQQTANSLSNSDTISTNKQPRNGNTTANSAFCQRGAIGSDLNSQSSRRRIQPVANKGSLNVHTNRSSLRQQLQQTSLLSDEPMQQNNARSLHNNNNAMLFKSKTATPYFNNMESNITTSINDELATNQCNSISRDSYLASLQERAAKAGVSIGEIIKPTMPTSVHSTVNNCNSTSTLSGLNQRDTLCASGAQLEDELSKPFDRKEIVSALSRVEARNDLSLLLPPIMLATNSQKQVNALSAGLEESDDSELFTDEIKRIVVEECNIIYECKECNNLFRSLANLVKHKRSYCTQHHAGSVNIEEPRQSDSGNNIEQLNDNPRQQLKVDQSISQPDINQDKHERSKFVNLQKNQPRDGRVDSRASLKSLCMMKNQRDYDMQLLGGEIGNEYRSYIGPSNPVPTSLSKLLKSQPRNRLPVSRDSSLIGSLSMIPVDKSGRGSAAEAPESNSIKCPLDLNDRLVRSSSLAKTLIRDKIDLDEQERLTTKPVRADKTKSCEEPSSADGFGTRVKKRLMAKRKLEDCIQKVKRDKLATDNDDINTSLENDFSTDGCKSNESVRAELASEHNKDSQQLSSLDSDADSDVLMIDLDESSLPHLSSSSQESSHKPKQAKQPPLSKPSSSSALLKALTRPVDAKPVHQLNPATPTTGTNQPTDIDSRQAMTVVQEARAVESKRLSGEQSSIELHETGETSRLASPLFDRYTCDICDQDFNDHASLTSHIDSNHDDQRMVYPCIFCSFSSITLENVSRHIIDIHKKPKVLVLKLTKAIRSRAYTRQDSSDQTSTKSSQRQDDHGSESASSQLNIDVDKTLSATSRQKPEIPSTNSSVSPASTGSQSLRRSGRRSNATSSQSSAEDQEDFQTVEAANEPAAMFEATVDESSHPDEEVIRIDGESPRRTQDPSGQPTLDDIQEQVDDEAVNVDSEMHEDVDVEQPAASVSGEDDEYSSAASPGIDRDSMKRTRVQDPSFRMSEDERESVETCPSSYEEIFSSDKKRDKKQKLSASNSAEKSVRFEVDENEAGATNNGDNDDDEDVVEVERTDDEEEDDDAEEEEGGGEEEEDAEENSDACDEESEEYGTEDDKYDEESSQEPQVDIKTSDSKSGLQSTPPSSGASNSGAGGPIMKLKIQLKKQPDEKSKVYRIVES